jgi:hypothetical protein
LKFGRVSGVCQNPRLFACRRLPSRLVSQPNAGRHSLKLPTRGNLRATPPLFEPAAANLKRGASGGPFVTEPFQAGAIDRFERQDGLEVLLGCGLEVPCRQERSFALETGAVTLEA